MLTVTDDARAHFSELIKQNDLPEEQAIRLVASQQGLGMTPDAEKPGDLTFDHDGRTVLLVEEQIATHLDERTIDSAQTDSGREIRIT